MGANGIGRMAADIRTLTEGDRSAIFDVINVAAEKYRGVIPAESDTDPYMPMAELTEEMAEMQFYGIGEDPLVGVIGVQELDDVSLIRHLYVRPADQRQGLGTTLLETAIDRADSGTILVGTWKAADWAIDFYRKNGFTNLGTDIDLLSRYWAVPEHQMAASVVLRYDVD